MDLERTHTRTLIIHVLMWTLFYVFFLFPFFLQISRFPPGFPLRLLAIMGLFYLNYFLLVPRLLLQKKIASYLLACILSMAIAGALIHWGIMSPGMSGPPRPMGPEDRFIIDGFIGQFINFLNLSTPIFISGVLRMYLEWKRNDDLRKKVESDRVNSELQFLKTQLNPHFLFNSLNTIYSLSVQSSTKTSEAIISLSELMRYMIYESDKSMVPLSKELEYIRNYVRLQRLRLSDSANVALKISGNDKGLEVPSLLFISFIENAFKYGTDYKGRTYVKINFQIEKDILRLTVENRIGVHRQQKKDQGIGLENIKNRLELLYPNSHGLGIVDNGKHYKVYLTLQFLNPAGT
ncbi:sensor histidine kinase [Flagellimonas aurea]|uniref:sensor histidine kinase n=1 Tax=Flagellimonas aurea TaxID=2915619 RepID=UPI0035CEA472